MPTDLVNMVKWCVWSSGVHGQVVCVVKWCT